MKNQILFIVSMLLVAFTLTVDAFGKGGRSNRRPPQIWVYDGIEISDPIIVEVDYSQKLGVLMRNQIFKDFYIDKEIDEEFTNRYSSKEKKKVAVYIVHRKILFFDKNSPEGRKHANEGKANELDESSEDIFQSDLKEKYPDLKPAGPYEVFSLAIQSPKVLKEYDLRTGEMPVKLIFWLIPSGRVSFKATDHTSSMSVNEYNHDHERCNVYMKELD